MNPSRRVIVVTASEVLRPWKRIVEAMIVDVEKPT